MSVREQWLAATMDEGIVAGPCATKREAVVAVQGRFATPTRTKRLYAGLFMVEGRELEGGRQQHTVYIGTTDALRREGWELG